MALLRADKSKICYAIRGYGTQRYQQNHYDTLNVSSDASQKEIRQAFIKLSKQLHPDTNGKQSSHADFVKLNEAYSVLGKEGSRRQYDFNLKYNRWTPSYTHNSQNIRYESQWEYEVRTAGGPWPPPQQKSNAIFGLIVALLFLSLGFFQVIYNLHILRIRRIVNSNLEREYQRARRGAHTQPNQFIVDNFEDFIKDRNEYLISDSDDC